MIVDAGDDSAHLNWIKDLPPHRRNWDLMVIQRGEASPEEPDADIVIRHSGAKYAAIFRLMQDIPWLSRYDRYWCCDEDIATGWSDIQRIFDLSETYDLALAQPAFAAETGTTPDFSTARPEYLLRYTNFAGTAATVFSHEALQFCLPDFENREAGGQVWPELPGTPRRKVAILDDVQVRRTGHTSGQPANDASLTYGYILKEPASGLPQGRTFVYPLEKRLSPRLTQLISCAITAPLTPQWQAAPVWQAAAPWSGGAALTAEIPHLPQEGWCLSLGLNFRLDGGLPASGTPEPLFYIGESRETALFAADLLPGTSLSAPQGYTLSCAVCGQQGFTANQTFSGFTFGTDCDLRVQIYPQSGWICIRINQIPCQDIWCAPYLWHSAHSVHIGNSALSGAIRNFWLSPTLTEENPADTRQTRQPAQV